MLSGIQIALLYEHVHVSQDSVLVRCWATLTETVSTCSLLC